MPKPPSGGGDRGRRGPQRDRGRRQGGPGPQQPGPDSRRPRQQQQPAPAGAPDPAAAQQAAQQPGGAAVVETNKQRKARERAEREAAQASGAAQQQPAPAGDAGQQGGARRGGQQGQGGGQDRNRAARIEGRVGEILSNKAVFSDRQHPGDYVTSERFGNDECRIRIYGIKFLNDSDLRGRYDIKLVAAPRRVDGELVARAVLMNRHGDTTPFEDAAWFDQQKRFFDEVERNTLQHKSGSEVRHFAAVTIIGEDADEDGRTYQAYFDATPKPENTEDGRAFIVRPFWNWRPKFVGDTNTVENPDIPLVVSIANPDTRYYEAIPVWQEKLVREYGQINAVVSHWRDALMALQHDRDGIRSRLAPENVAAFDASFTRVAETGRAVIDAIASGRAYIDKAADESSLDAREATDAISGDYHTEVAKAIAAFSGAMRASQMYVPEGDVPSGRFNDRTAYATQNGPALEALRTFVDTNTPGLQLSQDQLIEIAAIMDAPMKYVNYDTLALDARGGEVFDLLRNALSKLNPPLNVDIDPRFRGLGTKNKIAGITHEVAYTLNAGGSRVNVVKGDVIFDIAVGVETSKGGGSKTIVTFDTVTNQAARNAALGRLREMLAKPGLDPAEQKKQKDIATEGYQRCTLDEFMAMVGSRAAELADRSASAEDLALLTRLEGDAPVELIRYFNSEDYRALRRDARRTDLLRRVEALAVPRVTDYIKKLGFIGDLPYVLSVARKQDDADTATYEFDLTVANDVRETIPITGNPGRDLPALRGIETRLREQLRSHREAKAQALVDSLAARSNAFIAHLGSAPLTEVVGYMNERPLSRSFGADYDTYRETRANAALRAEIKKAIDARVDGYVHGFNAFRDLTYTVALARMQDDEDSATTQCILSIEGGAVTENIGLTGVEATDRKTVRDLERNLRDRLQVFHDARTAAQAAEQQAKRDAFVGHIRTAALPEVIGFLNGIQLPDTIEEPFRLYRGITDAGFRDQVSGAIVDAVRAHMNVDPAAEIVIGHPTTTDLAGAHTFSVTVPGTRMQNEPVVITGDPRADRRTLDALRAQIVDQMGILRDLHAAEELLARQEALRNYVRNDAGRPELIHFLNGGRLAGAALTDEYRTLAGIRTADAASRPRPTDLYGEMLALITQDLRDYVVQDGGLLGSPTLTLGHRGLAETDPFTCMVGLPPELPPTPIQLTGEPRRDRAEFDRVGALITTALETRRPAQVAERLTALDMPAVLAYVNGGTLNRADSTPFPAPYNTMAELRARLPDQYLRVAELILGRVRSHVGLPADPRATMEFTTKPFTFRVGAEPQMPKRDVVLTGITATDAAVCAATVRDVTAALEAQDRLATREVIEPRVGMRVRITDPQRFSAVWGIDPDQIPAGELTVVMARGGILALDFGNGTVGIGAGGINDMQIDGIIDVISAPLEFPANAAGSLAEFSEQMHIDPPLQPGEEFVYHGANVGHGAYKEGMRFRIVQSFAGGEYSPERGPVIQFWYSTAVDALGHVGPDGGRYSSGPDSGKTFSSEMIFPAATFVQMLQRDTEPRFERTSDVESAAARKAVGILRESEAERPVDGAKFLHALGLPTTEINGKQVMRFRWSGGTIAAREGVPAFETGSTWRVIGIDNQKAVLAREDELGVLTDDRRNMLFPDMVRVAHALEAPIGDDPFYFRLAQAVTPQIATPEAARHLLQGIGSFTTAVERPVTTMVHGKSRITNQATRANLIVRQLTEEQLVVHTVGDPRMITISHADFFGRIASGDISLAQWQVIQANEEARRKPLFVGEAQAGVAQVRFAEMLKAYGITIEDPMSALDNSEFETFDHRRLNVEYVDSGVVRFWTQEGRARTNHALTLQQFAVALHNGKFVHSVEDFERGATAEPDEDTDEVPEAPAPGVEPDRRGPMPRVWEREALEVWFMNEPRYHALDRELRESYELARRAFDDYEGRWQQYQDMRRQIQSLNAAANPGTVRSSEGYSPTVNLSRQQQPGLFGRLLGRKPRTPETVERYELPYELEHFANDNPNLRERAQAFADQQTVLDGEIAAMRAMVTDPADQQRLARRQAFLGNRPVPQLSYEERLRLGREPATFPLGRSQDNYVQRELGERLGGFTPERLARLSEDDLYAMQELASKGISFTDFRDGLQLGGRDIVAQVNSSLQPGAEAMPFTFMHVDDPTRKLWGDTVANLAYSLSKRPTRRPTPLPPPSGPRVAPPPPRGERYQPPVGVGIEEFLSDPAETRRLNGLSAQITLALIFSPRVARYLAAERPRLEGLLPQLEQMRARANTARERYAGLPASGRSDLEMNALVRREYALVSQVQEMVANSNTRVGSMSDAQALVADIGRMEAEVTRIVEGYEQLAGV